MGVGEDTVDVEIAMKILDFEGRRLAGVIPAAKQVTHHAVHYFVALLTSQIIRWAALHLALFCDEGFVLFKLLSKCFLGCRLDRRLTLSFPCRKHTFGRFPGVAIRNLY